MTRRRRLAGGLLLALSIPGCAGSGTPPPATSVLLDKVPRVDNATASPCWQQRQVAAQNSYFATIGLGREVIYKAPCDVDGKTGPARTTPAPTATIDAQRARRMG